MGVRGSDGAFVRRHRRELVCRFCYVAREEGGGRGILTDCAASWGALASRDCSWVYRYVFFFLEVLANEFVKGKTKLHHSAGDGCWKLRGSRIVWGRVVEFITWDIGEGRPVEGEVLR
jgi:hypothetical protein